MGEAQRLGSEGGPAWNVEDELVRMGDGQSAFGPWDDRRGGTQRREPPVTENDAWS